MQAWDDDVECAPCSNPGPAGDDGNDSWVIDGQRMGSVGSGDGEEQDFGQADGDGGGTERFSLRHDAAEANSRPLNQASPPNADTAGDTEDDTCTPAYKEDVLFHTCRLVLAVIVHDGARPSDWYDAESHGEVWTCPLLGCRHVVDPLSLDDEACHVVHSVLGVGGTSIDPWTSESVLARECEYDRRTNCCRLSMSPGEITHRRMCIDMIAWHHIEREHLRGYGVSVRDKGKAEDVEDAEAGIRAVELVQEDSNEVFDTLCPGQEEDWTLEQHRETLGCMRDGELNRLRKKLRELLDLLARLHRRIADHNAESQGMPTTGDHVPGDTDRMARETELRRECARIGRRRLAVKDALESWESWNVYSGSLPVFLP